MRNAANYRFWVLPSLPFVMCLTSGVVSGTEWKQTASVSVTEMPWGVFGQISIEYLPDLGDSIEDFQQYMDPAKQAELQAEVLAEAHMADPDVVGRNILITVPGLRYGMTGHWNNVRIESAHGISVPPDEAHIGTAKSVGQQTNYTGELTITEFTEEFLKGSYRARLYNAKASRREYEAGRRDFVAELGGELDFDLRPMVAPEIQLPGVPDNLSDSDAGLLQRIRAAGVPEDVQGQMLEMLRGMDPAMQDMVLESQSDSY